MCGIIGVASRSGIVRDEWITVGRDAMTHRGPDDAGIWRSVDRRVVLGHRRLAILDLSAAGHQPMQDAAGALTVVFNGEIYNYRDLQQELAAKGHTFRTQSDTEVILAAYSEWGEDCLAHFNGMFALALHDAQRQVLFLARDRAGEKPLFFWSRPGELCFASELKGLTAHPDFPRRIDREALDLYLTMGYVPGGRCIVDGVNKLPPAHAMVFDLRDGRTRQWRYWSLPDAPSAAAPHRVDERELLIDLEELLQDAVRRQLEADVPVGVLLSGGVDSSLITAMAVRASTRVKTFTVGFSGFGKYDESAHARLIADHFGTEHLELNAGQVGPDLLPMLARQYDEPMADSSMIPTFLVSRLVREHCTVALGGDGGDELFGGYSHYNRLLWTQEKFGRMPRLLRRSIACAGSMLPMGFRGRNWLQSLGCDLAAGLPLIASFFSPNERLGLVGGAAGAAWPLIAESAWRARVPQSHDLLQRATRMEFENYMAEDILVKVDRASMINSLELRAPILDYRIIEFAFGRVPSHLKATPSHRKILLKKLAEKLLPPQFDRQRKQGFSIPLADWLKSGAWRELFRDVLQDPNSIFDRKTVTRIMSGQDRGRRNEERLFSLALFELWRREYGMSL
jgi:asparagine synthase (glutamine-hydrolysing)